MHTFNFLVGTTKNLVLVGFGIYVGWQAGTMYHKVLESPIAPVIQGALLDGGK